MTHKLHYLWHGSKIQALLDIWTLFKLSTIFQAKFSFLLYNTILWDKKNI